MTVQVTRPRGVSRERLSGLDPPGGVGSSRGAGGTAPTPASVPAEVVPHERKLQQKIPHTIFEVPERDGEEKIGDILLFEQHQAEVRQRGPLLCSRRR